MKEEVKITKRQEVIDDVAGEPEWTVQVLGLPPSVEECADWWLDRFSKLVEEEKRDDLAAWADVPFGAYDAQKIHNAALDKLKEKLQ